MASLTLFLNMSSPLSRIKEDVISKVCVVYRLQITVVTIMNYILRSEPNDVKVLQNDGEITGTE